MDKIKSFLKKRKGFIILALVGIILGFSFYKNPTPEEINNLKAEKATILTNLDSSQKELSTLNEDISKLQDGVTSLTSENQKQEEVLKDTTAKIEQQKKDEAEVKAKEEAEKKQQEELEKQKQAEAERIAKEEAEKNNSQASTNASNNSYESNTNNSTNKSNSNSSQSSSSHSQGESKPVGDMVYITATGKKYHRINNCGKTNPAKTSYIPLSDAQSRGYTACSKCY